MSRPPKIDIKFLEQYPEFIEFRTPKAEPVEHPTPSVGKRPPRPLDFQCRDVRLTEKRRELVESLDRDMMTTKPTTQRRERDAVLGCNGIDGGFNPDYVEEPSDLADHRCR